MARTICLAALASLLSSGLVAQAKADHHSCQGISHDPPREPREGNVNVSYAGVVTEVTKDSITIQWVNTPGEKPKKFAVSETLAAGKFSKYPRVREDPNGNPALPAPTMPRPVMPEYMYRLADVKVGDCVGIFYARIGGVDICDHISICRRPGGEVPPLPKEAEDIRCRPELQKLRKRLKDAGLPVTKYVPYHEWINAYWAKVAPMPREVKPPGPARDP